MIVFLTVPSGAASATAAARAGLVVARRSVPVPTELSPAIHIYAVKEFVCDISGKTYKKAGKLKEHGLSHNPLVCAYCGKIFKIYSARKYHDRVAHGPMKKTCNNVTK